MEKEIERLSTVLHQANALQNLIDESITWIDQREWDTKVGAAWLSTILCEILRESEQIIERTE